MSPYKIYTVLSLAIITGCFYGLMQIVSWHWIISLLTVINTWTLVLYGWDKVISPTDTIRVPERILHILAFCGGSPAALLGQKLFRHKTQKNSFLFIYALIVIAQIALIAYLISIDRITL